MSSHGKTVSKFRKAAFYLLMMACLSSFYLIMPSFNVSSYLLHLFLIVVTSWVVTLVLFVGGSLIYNRSLRYGLKVWLGFVFLTGLVLIPIMARVLQLVEYEPLFFLIWVIMLFVILNWLFKKVSSRTNILVSG